MNAEEAQLEWGAWNPQRRARVLLKFLAISQIAVAEAFVLGERLGLTHQALFPVPSRPANRDYQPGFAGALMNKDLGLAEQAIDLTGVDAKLGRMARDISAEFAAGDGAGQDFSGIINTVRAQSAAV